MNSSQSKNETINTNGFTITLVNLLEPQNQKIFNSDINKAVEVLQKQDPVKLDSLEGEFALASFSKDKAGQDVIVGARTIGIPARFACQLLSSTYYRVIFAHTIREIAAYWLSDLPGNVQPEDLKPFDPAYTEMLPAFYIVTIKPWALRDREYVWFLQAPEHKRPTTYELLPVDVAEVGKAYVRAAQTVVTRSLKSIPENSDIGIGLSGGTDSSMITLLLIKAIEKEKRKNRLFLFTLSIGDKGIDKSHAAEFVKGLPEKYRDEWHPLSMRIESLHPDELRNEACRITEEYHIRDLECAMAGVTLLREIRKYHPDLKYLFDGDGGNEAFEDYSLEDEGYGRITIGNVWDDPHLFYLGYDRRKLPFNPIFSGGLSRAYVRTFNPGRHFGFIGFSPCISREVIKLAQHFPLRELAPTAQELHTLRGRSVQAGIKDLLGMDMPVFEKVRFQEGVLSEHDNSMSPFRVSYEQSTQCKNLLLRM